MCVCVLCVCCILLLVTQASSFTSASADITIIETYIEFVKLCVLVVFLTRFVSRYMCYTCMSFGIQGLLCARLDHIQWVE